MPTEIDREDVLLLIFDAYKRFLRKDSFNGMTRLEKLIFLFGAEGGLRDIEALFAFRAYKFGPYSKAVYEAAYFLESIELVRVEVKPYYSYFFAEEEKEFQRDIETDSDSDGPIAAGHEQLFTLTEIGGVLADKLRTEWEKDRPEYLQQLDTIVIRYGLLPLNQIIRYVYRRFPQMAEKSIHPEAQNLNP